MIGSAISFIQAVTHLFELLTSAPHADPSVHDMPSHVRYIAPNELYDKPDLRQIGNEEMIRQPGRKQPGRDQVSSVQFTKKRCTTVSNVDI
jgi:hypothetical protein